MSAKPPDKFDPAEFSGTARLFPLPNLVVFPQALQLIHIFEGRYREMVADALEGDRLIAMTLLSPGWEDDYYSRPPVYPVGCLGRIRTCQPLDDGRYNLLLHGLARITIKNELPAVRAFREAEVEIQQDVYPIGGVEKRNDLRVRLLAAFRRLLPDVPELREQVNKMVSQDVSLGALTDIVAYTLDLDLEQKMALLAEFNVDRRAEMLLDFLDREPNVQGEPDPGEGPWPPAFSDN